jgi:DNA-binding MarR family transcriptional regulator
VSQSTVERPTLEELSAELMLYTGRLVRAVTRQAVGTSTEVPTASLRLLSQIDELGPVGIGALAVADRCSQPTMSAGVRSLCRRGWAVKAPNPQDARSTLVTLTDEGRSVLEQARRERGAVIAARLRTDPHHDERDLATAVAVLRGLLEQPSPADPRQPTTTSRQGTA